MPPKSQFNLRDIAAVLAALNPEPIEEETPMRERNAIGLLVEAIETIQSNFDSGDLAMAVRHAIAVKDEVCRAVGMRSTAEIKADNSEVE